MSEGVVSATALLERGLDAVLAERPVDLPAELALARCKTLITTKERLAAATLAAVSDVDRRELFALDAAGSTRGWLRNQLGGDDGQLAQARRLQDHDEVFRSLACGELSERGAAQLCSALDKVPDQVEPDRFEAVLVDGMQELLGRQLGRGLPSHLDPTEAHLALRAELASTVGDALNDDVARPAARLEPALLLLAREVAPGLLGWSLKRLLDALLPDGLDAPDERDYYLDLVPVLDGDWDLRGHLDHETGTLLRDELDRRRRAREKATAAALRDADTAAPAAVASADPASASDASSDSAPSTPAGGPTTAGAEPPAPPVPFGPIWSDDEPTGPATDIAEPTTSTTTGEQPPRLVSKGQQRHDDLTQLLRDSADRDAGMGRPAPVAITVIATLDAVEGRAGALPGMLTTAGRPTGISTQALQRTGCHSELTAVLVDALGHPIGVSSPRRSASRRERAALTALWGDFCAVRGCTSTDTVPHHVEPWWLSRQTVLKHLLPLCEHDHKQLHEHHRTLELDDGRRIDQLGWVTRPD